MEEKQPGPDLTELMNCKDAEFYFEGWEVLEDSKQSKKN